MKAAVPAVWRSESSSPSISWSKQSQTRVTPTDCFDLPSPPLTHVRDAKVGDLEDAAAAGRVALEQQVAWFDVAVDDLFDG